MGAAARKIAHTAAPARPTLRLAPVSGRRTHARSTAAAAFRVVCVCLLILASAGVARVALAAQAAEAAVDAWELKSELKSARMQARGLEADRGSLAAPSRIEVLACETLNMDRPTEVCYLELPAPTGAPAVDEGGTPVSGVLAASGEPQPKEGAASRVLATLVDLAAGEAQVLLVGDMGLGLGR